GLSPSQVERFANWVKQLIFCHGIRHPRELPPDDLLRFLAHLRDDQRLSLACLHEAHGELHFLYREVLTQQLRELEDHVFRRQVYPVVPPKVEHSLTPYGRTLRPITELMCAWGTRHVKHLAEAKGARDTRAWAPTDRSRTGHSPVR